MNIKTNQFQHKWTITNSTIGLNRFDLANALDEHA